MYIKRKCKDKASRGPGEVAKQDGLGEAEAESEAEEVEAVVLANMAACFDWCSSGRALGRD